MFGNDFVQFCNRFCDHIELSQISCDDLYLLFLSIVDDQTYLKLSKIILTPDQKKNAREFCKIYKCSYYPQNMSMLIMADLMAMKHEIDESIQDFAFRIQQLAARLECSDNERQNYCCIVFIKNMSRDIRYELLKSDKKFEFVELTNFAEKLEQINSSFGNKIPAKDYAKSDLAKLTKLKTSKRRLKQIYNKLIPRPEQHAVVSAKVVTEVVNLLHVKAKIRRT